MIPLLAGSPAIDAGSCAGPDGPLSEDQRGYAMPIDGDNDMDAECDMGSYEFGSAPPLEERIFDDGFEDM